MAVVEIHFAIAPPTAPSTRIGTRNRAWKKRSRRATLAPIGRDAEVAGTMKCLTFLRCGFWSLKCQKLGSVAIVCGARFSELVEHLKHIRKIVGNFVGVNRTDNSRICQPKGIALLENSA
jgi:hypothetical protein